MGSDPLGQRMKASLFLRMFAGYAVVILFFALAVALAAPRPMRSRYVQDQAARLERLAAVLEAPVLESLGGRGAGPVEDYVRGHREEGRRPHHADPAGRDSSGRFRNGVPRPREPLRKFIDAAARVAAGDLRAKVSLRHHGEFRRYAASFNAMTQNLQTMFRETRLQGEELDGMLASVPDGLCLLDGEDRIVTGNEEFRRVAKVAEPEGKYFWEVVRSSELAELVKSVKASGRPVAKEVSLGGRTLSVRVSPLASRNRTVVILRETA